MKRLLIIIAILCALGIAALLIVRPWRADALPLYHQAIADYEAGQPDRAVAAVKSGLAGRLRLPSQEDDLAAVLRDPDGRGLRDAEMRSLRRLARQNASYAQRLAKAGRRYAALQAIDLDHGLAEQVLDVSVQSPEALVGYAIEAIAEAGRARTLRAAGDVAGAQAQQARFQALRRYFDNRVRPAVSASTVGYPQVCLDFAQKLAPDHVPNRAYIEAVARYDRQIAAPIVAMMRQGPMEGR